MKKSRFTLLRISLLALAAMALAQPARAGTAVWTPAGADTKLVRSANWVGGTGALGVAGSGDNVVFGPGGTTTAAFTTSNVVDSAFTILSLQYTNQAGFHNTLILPGNTLVINGATAGVAGVQVAGNALELGSAGAGSANSGVTISGSGAGVFVTNQAAEFLVSQSGTAASLNMTNLDNFTAYVTRVGVGVPPNYGWNKITQAEGGALQLAKTNYILTGFSAVPGVTTSYTNWTTYNYVAGHEIEEAIEVGNGADNSIGAASSVLLGLTNGFFVDSMGVGKSKSAGAAATFKFNPAFTNQNPTAYLRGTNGGRMAFLSVGDNVTGGSSSSGAGGTMDFTGGNVDAAVDVMIEGIDKLANTSGTTLNTGTWTFTAGKLDVNTLIMGAQESPTAANNQPNVGIVNVSGAGATLIVDTVLELGHTSLTAPTGTGPASTRGNLNITNGTAYINNAIVGTLSTNNTVLVNNGTLVTSNTLATNVTGLARYSLSNATVAYNIPASADQISLTKALVTGGSTNVVQLASVPVFASYPKQIQLIKYTALSGAGYNFGFRAATIPATAPNAYLSNNVSGSSVDLVLPNSPAPVIDSQPTPFSGDIGTNFSLTVVIDPASVTPQGYQWYYYTNAGPTNPVSDGLDAYNSTITGSQGASLSVSNAQTNDSGNYFVVVTNVDGVVTSSVTVVNISSGCVGPQIVGPANQTVIMGNDATFTASVSANPTAAVYWTRDGVNIGNDGNQTLIVHNVQYPADDQALFCIVASNACGMMTNCATLSVIWGPIISNQPASTVVTNTQTASFTVVAGGVPNPGYQWRSNTIPITGNASALTATLVIPNASPANDASYDVVVTNAAGTVISSPATLTVNSADLAISSMSPANGQTNVCYDTPLYATFNQPPKVGTVGKIKIFNASNPATPVDTLDLSLNSGGLQPRTVGGVALNAYPVIVNGNIAAIFPHSNVMTLNQTYYVTIDDGALTDASGAYYAGLTDTNAWRFTTKATGAANPTNIMVAADGSGDFATVQGAVDSVANGNTTPTAIRLRDGTYTEVVRVNTKNNIAIIGQTRAGTIVQYANNNNINPSTTARPSFGITGANDCSVQNLTILNSTPHGGSQAEALFVTGSKRFIALGVNVDSFQDTLLCNAPGDQEYIQDSHIQGDTDFVWGQGTLYASNTEFESMTSGGHLTQARTPQGSNGLAFVNCLVDGAPGVTGSDLGRDAANASNGNNFYGETAYINCIMDTNVILSAGWVLGSGTTVGNTANLRFWEYESVDTNGNPVNTSQRVAWSTEIDGNTATNGVQNLGNWFSGWIPALSPNIIAGPFGPGSIAGGSPATFIVVATGIPAPSYQWYKNGNPITGATSATYTIAAAYVGDAGTYSVTVSNASGALPSTSTNLAVGNSPPSLSPIADLTVNVGVNITVTPSAADPDQPTQTLSFSDNNVPVNASFDTGTGILTWRPTVQQAGTTTPMTITVTDNGAPNLSASQSFNLIVNPLTQPDISAPGLSGGQFSLTVGGQQGPDYAVQTSTNLIDWTTVQRYTSPTMPFTFVDTAPTAPYQFYRIMVGPPLP